MKTQDQLESDTQLACEATYKDSTNSEESCAKQIFNHIGFYQGYCKAMGWEQDHDFVAEMIRMTNDD